MRSTEVFRVGGLTRPNYSVKPVSWHIDFPLADTVGRIYGPGVFIILSAPFMSGIKSSYYAYLAFITLKLSPKLNVTLIRACSNIAKRKLRSRN